MPIIEITDLGLPELEVYTRLTEQQLRCRREPEKGMFIAESGKVISHALDAGYKPVSLLMERKQISGQAAELIARCGDIPVYTADREVLSQLTGYALTRGFLCAMSRKPLPQPELLLQNAHRVAVLEGIVDPTNVGAILRSAAGLHVDAVLLSPSCCDPLNRRAVRVSMGTVFQVPWTRLGSDSAHWQESIPLLKAMGFQTVALALDHRAVSISDPVFKTIDRLAIFLGTEGEGLDPRTIAQCDYTAMIPMSHGVDSLNVAAASAVAFWQFCGNH